MIRELFSLISGLVVPKSMNGRDNGSMSSGAQLLVCFIRDMCNAKDFLNMLVYITGGLCSKFSIE